MTNEKIAELKAAFKNLSHEERLAKLEELLNNLGIYFTVYTTINHITFWVEFARILEGKK